MPVAALQTWLRVQAAVWLPALVVLGVCGANDPYPDQPDVLRGMAKFREAPQIAGAARFVNWEKPAEFNAAISAFLQSLP